MVTITSYVPRTRKDGTTFIALEITGGVELVQSSNTGNFYATVRKCTIPSTFDENIAKGLIGSQIPGDVVKVNVPAYEYINKRTGEIMQLQHSFAYRPEGSMELIGQTQVSELEMA
jgi:hypothetical protein